MRGMNTVERKKAVAHVLFCKKYDLERGGLSESKKQSPGDIFLFFS